MTRTICLLVGVLLSALASAATLPTPEVVSEQIRLRGARQTVVSLAASGQIDAILDLIGRGNERWIALAPSLAKGADGSVAYGFGVDLARALLITPSSVLRVLQPGNSPINVDSVCGVPFIEPPAGYDAAYVRQAIRSLALVRDPKLRELKAECLKALQS